MTYRLWVDPRAEAEIAAASDAYESIRRGYGAAFLIDVDYTVALILAAPRIYASIDGVLRRAVLRRFPFNLYYRLRDASDDIEIIGCIHGSTHPLAIAASLATRAI